MSVATDQQRTFVSPDPGATSALGRTLASAARAGDVICLWVDLGAGKTHLAKAFGAGLVVVGAAMGIGRLASSAYESMARQPEVAGTINTAMIIAAALIEGFTFYALYICSTQV